MNKWEVYTVYPNMSMDIKYRIGRKGIDGVEWHPDNILFLQADKAAIECGKINAEEDQQEFHEDKELITRKIFEYLKVTWLGHDINSMEYYTVPSAGFEYVVVKFGDGTLQQINVSGDSGYAMMLDIVGELA